MIVSVRQVALIVSIILLFSSCKSNTSRPQLVEKIVASETATIEDNWYNKYDGVLVYDFANGMNDVVIYINEEKSESITLNYETDLLIYKEKKMSFQEEYSDDIYENYGIDAKFFEFGGPSFFHCFVIDKGDKHWKIEFGDFEGYISKTNNKFTFLTPNEYLSNFLIGTDLAINPVRKSATKNSEIIKLDTSLDWAFDVLEIKGDWMKVQSFNMCDGMDEDKFIEFEGWLQFKNGNKILIEQYFGC